MGSLLIAITVSWSGGIITVQTSKSHIIYKAHHGKVKTWNICVEIGCQSLQIMCFIGYSWIQHNSCLRLWQQHHHRIHTVREHQQQIWTGWNWPNIWIASPGNTIQKILFPTSNASYFVWLNCFHFCWQTHLRNDYLGIQPRCVIKISSQIAAFIRCRRKKVTLIECKSQFSLLM